MREKYQRRRNGIYLCQKKKKSGWDNNAELDGHIAKAKDLIAGDASVKEYWPIDDAFKFFDDEKKRLMPVVCIVCDDIFKFALVLIIVLQLNFQKFSKEDFSRFSFFFSNFEKAKYR